MQIFFFDKGERIDEFVEIYNETMQNHNADEYYFFEKKYFEFIKTQMKENLLFGYAEYEGKIVSASIFFLMRNICIIICQERFSSTET